MENWKDIEGFEGLYQVSDMGRVRSLKTRRILKPMARWGYLYVGLFKSGSGQKNFQVHRLVAKAFVPNPLGKPCVNHLDEDRANNSASNLEWCTVVENDNYGTRNERIARILGKPVAQYDKLGNRLAVFQSTQDACRRTGVHQSNICQCCKGRKKTAGGYTWRYVT